jgi:zinc/manganese transport system permease protein
MNAFLEVMALPLVACLVLAGIHAYLGYHVLRREVIFVDLALAQIAALGTVVAMAFGWGGESPLAYGVSLAFTVIGAAIFALTRFRKQRIPQEAVIGIVYVVTAALLILLLGQLGEGDEHMRHALVGNILLVTQHDILKMAAIYVFVGVFHYVFRERFFLISRDAQEAFSRGWNVRWWDFLFYVSFGFVVTSSVEVAGVLLVFTFLVIPAACGVLLADGTRARLAIGWAVGFVVSAAGIALSYYRDWPTGPSVICAFGSALLLCGLLSSQREKIK